MLLENGSAEKDDGAIAVLERSMMVEEVRHAEMGIVDGRPRPAEV
jgi:hypothetical protein